MGFYAFYGVAMALAFTWLTTELTSFQDAYAQSSGSQQQLTLDQVLGKNPPSMNAGSMGQIPFSNCIQDPVAGISQFFSNLKGSGEEPSGCGAPGAIHTDLSCSDLKVGGKFNLAQLNEVKASNTQTVRAYSCQLGKLTQINTQFECLSNVAGQFAEKVAFLQGYYTGEIQKMQSHVSLLDQIVEDRNEQLKDVKEKLHGDRDSGRGGLLELQQQTRELAQNKMPAEIEGMQQQFNEIDQQKRSLDELIQTSVVAEAQSCFSSRTHSNFKCDPKSEPTNAKDYLLCRYEQQLRVGGNGNINRGGAAQQRAVQKREGLARLLDKILGEMAKNAEVPSGSGNPNQAANQRSQFANQGVTVLSYQDILNQYQDEIAKYNGEQIDVLSFFRGAMSGCFTRAQKIVNRKRKRATTEIGRLQHQIKQGERQGQAHYSQLLSKYSDHYGKMVKGLTGKYLPIPKDNCFAATPDLQMSCLQDIRRNIVGVLDGTTPQSKIKMLVRGNATNVEFDCHGINSCVSDLQNISTNVKKAVSKVQKDKKEFIQKANQNILAQTERLALQLSPESKALNNYSKQINILLASLGVKGGVEFDPVKEEDPEKDENGLQEPPKNIVNYLGSKMNPPMLNIHGSTFADALSGIADRKSEIQKEIAEVNSSERKLASLANECREEDLKDLLANAESAALNFDRHDCARLTEFCGDSGRNQMDALMAHLESFTGLPPGARGKLESGLDICGRYRQNELITGASRSLASSDSEGDESGGSSGQTGEQRSDSWTLARCEAVVRDVRDAYDEVDSLYRRGSSSGSSADTADSYSDYYGH